MAQQKVVVEIFGQNLNLRSTADPQYAASLAEYVDGQIRRVSRQSNDPLKVVLLASMNIANDLFQERKNQEESNEALSKKADLLLEMVDRAV